MTDGPDDILRGLIEGDSEGPEATAEQEAFVSGLLGSLRRDDPPMPDDVLRRLDAVLAEERRTGAPALVALPGGGSDPDDADLGAGSVPVSLPENVSVLPTAAERRGPTSRSFRILGGLAAAAVVVVGGAVVINNGSLGSSSDTSGGAAAALAVVQDSNTAYSSKSFSDQAEELARKVPSAEAGNGGGSPVSAPESTAPATPTAEATGTASTVAPSSTSLDTASAEPVTPERALLCTREISAGTVTEPLLVDQGTYDGKDAEIYVLPSVDSPGQYDVYVVAAGCTTGSFELFTLQRVTRP